MFDFGKWLKIFDYKNLEGFFRSEQGKGGVAKALGRVTVGYLSFWIPVSIIVLILIAIGAEQMGTGLAAAGGIAGAVVSLIMGTLFYLVLLLVFFLINNGIYHLIAGVLGGKGKYGDFSYLASFIVALFFLVLLPLLLLFVLSGAVECLALLSCVVGLAGIAFLLYLLYAAHKAVLVNYGLSSGRAAAVVVLNLLFWAIVLAILVGVFMMVVGTIVSEMMSNMPAGGFQGY